MIQKTNIPGINGKIRSDSCGTAFQKTISIKVNCEMDIDSAKYLISQINANLVWLKDAPKGCENCDHRDDCSEKEK